MKEFTPVNLEHEELKGAHQWVLEQLQEQKIAPIIDGTTPTSLFITFYHFPEAEQIEPPKKITTAEVTFIPSENHISMAGKVAHDEIEQLQPEQQAALVGYMGAMGELVSRVGYGIDPIEKFNLRTRYYANASEALNTVYKILDQKQLAAKNKEISKTGLENNQAYTDWMKFVGEHMNPWKLQIRTAVDPINKVLKMRLVSSDYDPTLDPSRKVGTLVTFTLPRDIETSTKSAIAVEVEIGPRLNEKYNTAQTAIAMALSITHVQAVIQAQVNPEADLSKIKAEFERAYEHFLTNPPGNK